MLIRIIKIITSLFCIAILAFLVSQRDFTLPSKKQNSAFPPTSPQKMEIATLRQDDQSVIQDTVNNNSVVVVPQKEIVEVMAKNPPRSISPQEETATVYEKLNEGVSDSDESYYPTISPCKTPMGYKIGTFDTRFGISKTSFQEEIRQAGAIWGDEIGKTLFYPDPNGPLTVNLIYDERQARTDDVNYLVLEIENSKQTALQIKEVYELEKTAYLRDAEQLTKDTEDFQLRYKAYTDRVTSYNSSGGAPKIEYDAMMYELAQLKESAKTLNDRKDALIITMESINKKVIRYNELVAYINSLIRQSNAIGAKKFTEGRFTPANNTIDIYQYNDALKLRRVLAHELGHVLGSNHNKNPYSIMYSSNTATTTYLSKEDKQGLHEVCPF